MAYLLSGVIIWRDAQIKEGYPIHEIDRRNMKQGDLLFFPHHVAMYMEHGSYIHSTGAQGSDGVSVNSLDPAAPDYRADLAESLIKVGSVF
jgi:cell wall-associated NlpC family hydrolase